jgi:DDE superfamily endonuclease
MAYRGTGVWQSPVAWSEWTDYLAAGLHGRHRWRLAIVLFGMLFARGRRTVTSWLRAAGIGDDFQNYYYFIAALGRKAIWIMAERMFLLVLRVIPAQDRLTLIVDDSPTSRYGRKVEGAGIHHNPTKRPDDHKFLYGHVWVVLALAIRHVQWHTIGLPLLGLLYVKAKDIAKLPERYGWKFQTKLELAARLIPWVHSLADRVGRGLDVVFDGAYAYRPLLKQIVPLPVRVFSRLRRDAELWSLPPPASPGTRGARRKYGRQRVALAKRAGASRGWQEVECTVYGQKQRKRYKTFLATSRLIGGVIRVVLVKNHDGSWEPFFCTDPQATAVEILEKFSDRSSIEQVFHDAKEVWGSGQQQVRNLWCNLGVFNLNLWMHTLVELWAWSRAARTIRNRRDSPWDDPERRPSHADRRKALRWSFLEHELSKAHEEHPMNRKIQTLFKRLARMAA